MTHFELFKSSLEMGCLKSYGVDLILPPKPADVLNIRYSDEIPESLTDQTEFSNSLSISKLYRVRPVNARYLTSGSDVKKVIKVTLDVKEAGVKFQPGDTVGIVSPNLDTEVELIADCLNIKEVLHKKYTLEVEKGTSKAKAIPDYIPSSSTLYNLFKTCVDFRTVPKKALLRVLVDYTSDEREKNTLEELCCKQGSNTYSVCILEHGATVLDVLKALPSCRPPVERLLEHLPRLMPRRYSIASSPLKSSDNLDIVLTVVEEPRQGICSTWLDQVLQPLLIHPESLEKQLEEKLSMKAENNIVEIPLFFCKRSNFCLPEDTKDHLVLIGSGTGIAPFIGFLQHREAQKEMFPSNNYGEIWLFAGCRYSDRDYLFKSEIEHFLEKGVLTRLFTAFSRENNQQGAPRYVQDNILKNASLGDMIFGMGAIVYVCGNKNMTAVVKDAICTTSYFLTSFEQRIAETDMYRKRYRQEVWT